MPRHLHLALIAIWLALPAAAAGPAIGTVRAFDFHGLRLAVEDLSQTFGARYPKGAEYLQRLAALEKKRAAVLAAWTANPSTAEPAVHALAADLERLRYDALLANPLLDFDKLLLVKRAWDGGQRDRSKGSQYRPSPFYTSYGPGLGLPVNHTSLASVEPEGYDNEIAILSPVRPEGRLTTFYRPKNGEYVGEIELHWDARRLLFTSSPGNRYRVFEIRADGSGLRQVTPDDQPDVDNFDSTYLPNGKILFASNASYQAVPCWNGLQTVANLYSINGDGTGMRQLTFDQDEDSHPTVLNTGQVLYCRWEYTNTPHVFPHLLFQMNPDGTGQREFYGSNSYWPNSIYFPRAIPGHATKIVGVISGYHGDHRMGELFVIDPARGRDGKAGMVQRIPGRGSEIETPIRDFLTSASWPKFAWPWPLSDKYFLVSMKPSPEAPFGIYLVDVWDNLLLLHETPGYALLEPTPLRPSKMPPAVAEKVDPKRKDAVVYLHDVYRGPGLAGVPRGAVKNLRVHAYHWGYRGISGWDKVGIDGPWDVMRILGTVPVEPDGSAMFRVPANTPITVQPLDARGRALQVMRSWFTAMPGEVRSCVGCHEPQNTLPPVRQAAAATREPSTIAPFYGPARGFDFERDVQPVLDRYCAACHSGVKGRPDLRAADLVPDYKGIKASVPQWWSKVDHQRYDAGLMRVKQRKGFPIRFTPAYEALHPYARRYGLEGDYVLSNPGEYHASTSELIQMLEKGHHGVRLDAEAWDRLYTWIDLNVPAHGTWGQIYPIPFNGRNRRLELAKLYGGLEEDFEAHPPAPPRAAPVQPKEEPLRQPDVSVPGWPFTLDEARRRQRAAGRPFEREVDLGKGIKLKLVLVPAGEFLMGSAEGAPDERPLHPVTIAKPFWMAALEITNEQYALFDPRHDSRYINVLNMNTELRGFPVNGAKQPVVRVSHSRAAQFCAWLSRVTGMKFGLPTEEQWEWAARAGSATPFHFGSLKTGFEQYANFADASLRRFYEDAMARGAHLRVGQQDWMLRVAAVNDGHAVTAPAGSYYPNPWGLHDMNGNAAEWTRSEYRDYAGGKPIGEPGRRVVRGGSWYDRPHRATSGFRWAYPEWQPVYNVGIRVVAEVQ